MSNVLIGDDEQVKAQEELLASLTSIATRIDEPAKPVRSTRKARIRVPTGVDPDDEDPRLKSPFFFVTAQSIADEIKAQQADHQQTAIKPVDDHLAPIVHNLKKTMPKALGQGIDKVRDFYLNDIAPLAMSAESGADQAKHALQQLLNVPIENHPFTQFEIMTRMAARMRMASYLVKHFKLPKGSEQALLDAVAPARPQLVPIPSPLPEYQPTPRPDKRTSTTPMLSKPIKRSYRDEQKKERT